MGGKSVERAWSKDTFWYGETSKLSLMKSTIHHTRVSNPSGSWAEKLSIWWTALGLELKLLPDIKWLTPESPWVLFLPQCKKKDPEGCLKYSRESLESSTPGLDISGIKFIQKLQTLGVASEDKNLFWITEGQTQATEARRAGASTEGIAAWEALQSSFWNSEQTNECMTWILGKGMDASCVLKILSWSLILII